MNKNYTLRLDLKFKCNNPTMEFDKFDNDTSSFFILITNGGELVDIDKAIVVLAAIKPSGKVESQFIEVESNGVYANLKPSMKDEIGDYTARAMLILSDKKVVTDTISYTVPEDNVFSLLNDSVQDDENFTLLTEMLSRLSTIETNEKTRVANEVDRLELQNKLEQLIQEVEKSEVDRKAHEVDREKLHLEMEDVLNEAKTINTNSKSINNVSNELITSMKSLNDNVLNAYNDVVEATKEIEIIENEVSENEAERQKFYGNSKIIIQNVENSEESRQLNEDTRIANEKSRELKVGNYETRYEKLINDTSNLKNSFNEFNSQANSNEEARVQSENERKNRYNQFESDYNTLRDNINNQLQETNQTKNALINELNQSKSDLTNTVRNEITSQTEKVNNKITEIDNIKNQMVYNATNATNEANKLAGVAESVINEVNNVKVGITNNVNTVLTSKVNEVNQTKTDLTNTVNTKINEIVNTFNTLTAQQQQDAEVITARDGEISLKARLDRDLEKGKETFIDVEGSYISTDSNEGYLRNIEILGNTIQDSNNLSDIRSVGYKVEGQELYKIPIVSCGKNLNNTTIKRGNINTDTGLEVSGGNTILCTSDFIQAKPLTKYVVSSNLNISSLLLTCYNKNKDYLGFCNIYNGYFETKENTKYIKFRFKKYNNEEFTDLEVSNINVQFEEGTIATQYEPYQEYKLELLSPVQLEKVGDVADGIICKDGIWGVENWITTCVLDSKLSNVYINISEANGYIKTPILYGLLSVSDAYREAGQCITTFGKTLTPQEWNARTASGIYIGKTAFGIVIEVDKVGGKTKTDLVNYFSNNPQVFKYIRNTPDFIPLPHDQQVKLKAFSGKTNISFLTEVEGTIKAQVPKSLAASINTHTTQIDNLNKELDRVKKLEESKVSTVETESNFTTVEETSNGYFEDIKLEGKTLVNLCDKTPHLAGSSVTPIVNNENNCTTVTLTSSGSNVLCYKLITKLKQSTTYTVICKIKSNYVDTSQNYNIAISFGSVDNSDYGVSIKRYKKDFSQNFVTLVTKLQLGSNVDVDKLVIGNHSIQSVGNFLSVKDIIVLEGDYTQNPPEYFEGLMSIGQDVDEVSVESVNKNLIDINSKNIVYAQESSKPKVIHYIEGDSLVVESIGNYTWGFVNYKEIKVNPNTTYTFTPNAEVVKGNVAVWVYDNNDNKLFEIANQSKTFITSASVTSLSIRFYCQTTTNYSEAKIKYRPQLEEGGVYTDYVVHQLNKKPLLYYNPTTQTWEKPILIDWDSIEKHSDGKYYYHKRSEEVVLNGSEAWVQQGTNDALTLRCAFVKDNCLPGLVVCDRFSNLNIVGYSNIEGIFINTDKSINLFINKSKLSTQDVEGFKAWLQVNPTTIVYQLAKEEVYECTNIDLMTYSGETNYIVNSGAITPKSTIKVHNNISNIVRLLQSKVSILENNMTDYMVTQNRLLLTNRYSTDNVGFTVDTATFSLDDSVPQYDNDLYNLILNNILVGKDNYNRDYMESLINFYWMTFAISDEMYFTLSSIIEEQYTEQENITTEESPTE